MKKRKQIKIRNFQINLSNKTFYTLLLVSALILLGVGVYAVAPNPGHTASEIDFSGGFNVPSGNVGIGNTAPSEKLTVSGNVLATAYYYSSDRRLKENIVQISDAVSIVENLEGVSFNWKENGEKSIGLIAQDVEKVLPEIVSTDNKGYKSISYANLVAVLIEAVKEQQGEINELKNQLNNEN